MNGFSELAGLWLALLLTLFIFSSLWRDNVLSRLAEHLLIGTASAYAAVVAIDKVLLPRLLKPLWQDPIHNWHLLVPLILALLWLAPWLGERGPGRLPPDVARWAGSLGLALLFGVGAGLVVGGAWQGTLWPQIAAAIRPPLSGNGLLVLLATLGVPIFLHGRLFIGRQRPPGRLNRMTGAVLSAWSWLGQATLLLGAGVIFARAATARLALLIDRWQFIMQAAEQTGLLKLAQAVVKLLGGG